MQLACYLFTECNANFMSEKMNVLVVYYYYHYLLYARYLHTYS
jgi:hypothetical protein